MQQNDGIPNGIALGEVDGEVHIYIGGVRIEIELSTVEMLTLGEAFLKAGIRMDAAEETADDMLAEAFRKGDVGHA